MKTPTSATHLFGQNFNIMAYDIYGNNLRRGYCEVHPNVHEEYPCSLCLAESQHEAECKENMTLDGVSILKGYKMTITKGLKEEFCLWHNTGLYDIPSTAVGRTIRVLSEF